MTNKELEKLFKNKLGSRKVDFDSSSWEDMERVLDSKMPVVPWYLPFASWIKGITAAMVVGFSGYFIFGEPFDGYTKENYPTEVNSPFTTVNTTPKLDSARYQKSTNPDITGNSRLSDQINETPSSEAKNDLEALQNKLGANSFAYADGKIPERKARRKNKKQVKQNLKTQTVQERFVKSNQLNTKPLPDFEIDYSDQTLADGSRAFQKRTERKAASNTSPLKIGGTLGAITSRNLLPESEGSLNTGLKPGFSFGLLLSQPLNDKWGISGGLNYKWQKANTSCSSHDVNYSFGEEHIYTTVDYCSLNNLELPLSTYYKLSGRHQINFGVYASYLWAASANYKVETIKAFGSEKETGRMLDNSSIKDVWDYGATAGYYYSINSMFQIGVDSWFGVTPLQYNPDNSSQANNFQLRFTLNYWLL